MSYKAKSRNYGKWGSRWYTNLTCLAVARAESGGAIIVEEHPFLLRKAFVCAIGHPMGLVGRHSTTLWRFRPF